MAFNQDTLVPMMLIALLILQAIRDLRRDSKNVSTWFISALYLVFAMYYMGVVFGKLKA